MTPYLQNRSLFPPQISNKPSLVLGIIVVIPCYNEPDVLRSLLSLQKCTLPNCDVEVIVVINNSEAEKADIREQNKATYEQLTTWSKTQLDKRLKFHILLQDELPKKHAGVGMARKIGMDEAVWRFEKAGNKKGIIACFDADSRCEQNYFLALENYFTQNPKMQAASIHYEHPLAGIDFEEDIYESILLYELHLRYYVHIQKWAGFPFAFQTIGSSMAVLSDAYQQQGGMNKRKAGEDFYFLQKFIELERVGELTETTVIPSPRISDRVPFGTGKAVGEIIGKPETYTTYSPQIFIDLKHFFDMVDLFYDTDFKNWKLVGRQIPSSIYSFLGIINFLEKMEELKENTSTNAAFRNRFFRWFNAFKLMKYVHFMREKGHPKERHPERHYPNVSLEEASRFILELYGESYQSNKETLLFLRKKDKGEA